MAKYSRKIKRRYVRKPRTVKRVLASSRKRRLVKTIKRVVYKNKETKYFDATIGVTSMN